MANKFRVELRSSNVGWNWATVFVEEHDNLSLFEELRSQGNFEVASFGPSFEESVVKAEALKWIEVKQSKLDASDFKFRKYDMLEWDEKYGDVIAYWTNKITGKKESDLFTLNLHKNFDNAQFVKWLVENADANLSTL